MRLHFPICNRTEDSARIVKSAASLWFSYRRNLARSGIVCDDDIVFVIVFVVVVVVVVAVVNAAVFVFVFIVSYQIAVSRN